MIYIINIIVVLKFYCLFITIQVLNRVVYCELSNKNAPYDYSSNR